MSAPARIAGVSLLLLAQVGWATEPVRMDYMLNCQGCHLPDGAGFEARGVPSLRGRMASFLQVEGGRAFLIQVPGSALSDLDDARLSAVVNWMLHTFSAHTLPTDFEPYTEAEVALLRRNPLIDVKTVRAALIGRIDALGEP